MKKLKLMMIVVSIITAIVAIEVVDYTIYKAKYPNTTMWMWVLDTNK